MDPKFFGRLNLKNSSQTVEAGGPCNWEDHRKDAWAQVTLVTIDRNGVVGSSGTASATVYRNQDENWWLDAIASSSFTRGTAQVSAHATVHTTDNNTYEVQWPDVVELH
jgi:hypothetical protein